MVSDCKKKTGTALTDRSSIRLVEELYLLADMISSASNGGISQNNQIIADARARLKELLEANNTVPLALSSNDQHLWVVSVLTDLASYADSEQLPLLQACLLITKGFIEDLFKSGAIGKANSRDES
ncbi:hypothetical protein [uncultured Roseovarius sp.]|uniref:hypothetical protein n=1 Tax=uncultured Roseovarius sp. TaxID=293344 RepID=UPI002622A9DF|nr:hypothetical protein [uncultured Roseovarius sp.]